MGWLRGGAAVGWVSSCRVGWLRGGLMVAGWAVVVGLGLGCGLRWLRFFVLVVGWAGAGWGWLRGGAAVGWV